MNVDELKGLLRRYQAEAKRMWRKLTDDDWKVVEADAEALAGRIQERYGRSKEAAKQEIEKLFQTLGQAPSETR